MSSGSGGNRMDGVSLGDAGARVVEERSLKFRPKPISSQVLLLHCRRPDRAEQN